MKESLAHLPKHKRDGLKRVKEIILDECCPLARRVKSSSPLTEGYPTGIISV